MTVIDVSLEESYAGWLDNICGVTDGIINNF